MIRFFSICPRLTLILSILFCWELHAEPRLGIVSRLLCEDKENPIGIDDLSPDFRWEYNQNLSGFIPDAYQLIVGSSRSLVESGVGDLWDSGKIGILDPTPAAYSGKELRSRQIAFWAVRFWSKTGELSAYSKIAKFEMALLKREDWLGSWIWGEPNLNNEHLYFRHSFNNAFKKEIRSVRIYISLSHQFELFINGQVLSRATILSDGSTYYYRTIEIDPQIFKEYPAGDNSIVIRAHWLGAGQSRLALSKGLLFQMEFSYADGSTKYLVSDESWEYLPAEWYWRLDSNNSPVFFRNNEGVPTESLNLALAPSLSYSEKPRVDEKWLSVRQLGRVSRLVGDGILRSQLTDIEETVVTPLTVRKIDGFGVVADFGKIFPARPKIVFHDHPDQHETVITAAYRLLDDGTPKSTEQRTDMTYRYRPSRLSRADVFLPSWYLGMRYVGIKDPSLEIDAINLSLIARRNRVDRANAIFSSSDQVLNRLWEIARHSSIYGAQDQFIDTPTREQGQFSYDSYLTGMALASFFGERLLNKQALLEFARSQRRYEPADGRIDAAYPNSGPVQNIADWTLIWPIWAFEFYMASSDLEIVRELYPALIETGRWIESRIDSNTGLVDLGNDRWAASGFVDWPDRYAFDLNTSQRSVINAYALSAFSALSKLAKLVGDSANEGHFGNLARLVRKSIRVKLWSDKLSAFVDGLLPDGSQSDSASEQTNAILLSLHVPEKHQVEGALNRIREDSPKTSLILSRFIVSALGEHGQADRLLRYLRTPNGRNFAQIIEDGATYTWESWEGHKSKSGDSESHAYGALTILRALFNYIAGVQCQDVGCQQISIRPLLGNIKQLEATIPAEVGSISVSWASDQLLSLRIPARAIATVCMPSRVTQRANLVLLNGVEVDSLPPSDGCAASVVVKGGFNSIEIK